MQNHFALFHLPQQFIIDTAALDRAYHEVQNQVHPDKFVAGSDAEKRVAMQWATRANEAYQTLRAPLRRATYLCELNGTDLQTESNTAMPMPFLLQQMQWREALDAARAQRDGAELDQLDTQVKEGWQACYDASATAIAQGDFVQAARIVREWMFLEKFREEIGRVYDTLDG